MVCGYRSDIDMPIIFRVGKGCFVLRYSGRKYHLACSCETYIPQASTTTTNATLARERLLLLHGRVGSALVMLSDSGGGQPAKENLLPVQT